MKYENSEKFLTFLKNNDLEVFRIKDLTLFFKREQLYGFIRTLTRNNKIIRIKNGLYALEGTNEFIIATKLIEPSYVSFMSALNYYELIDQYPRKVTLVSTNNLKHDSVICATVNKKLFFGYVFENGFSIASIEKSILDSLYLPKYAGGIKNIIIAMKNAKNQLDLKKLEQMAKKYDSKILIKRLMFICKKFDIKLNLESDIKSGYELFDPDIKKNVVCEKKFGLLVNGDLYDWD